MQRQRMGFGCSAAVLLSVGRKISGNFKTMLNASSDGKSASACPEDSRVATALPQAFPRAPTACLCSLKDLSKSLSQSHDCFQSPYAPSSQHKTPVTLLNNKTSKVALRSNPTKTNKPLHSSNRRPLSGKKAGYGHKGRDHTAVAAKKETPVSSIERFPTHINKPCGHVFLVTLRISSAPEPSFSRQGTFSIRSSSHLVLQAAPQPRTQSDRNDETARPCGF